MTKGLAKCVQGFVPVSGFFSTDYWGKEYEDFVKSGA